MALIRIQSSPLPAKPWNSASPRRGALSRVKEFLLCFPVPRLPSDPERNPCTPPRPDNGNDYNPAISSGTQPLPSSLPSIDGRQSDGFWALNLTHGRAGDRGPNVYALPTALRMLASAAPCVFAWQSAEGQRQFGRGAPAVWRGAAACRPQPVDPCRDGQVAQHPAVRVPGPGVLVPWPRTLRRCPGR